MTLIASLGALLKYELHQIGGRDAAVLVSMTPAQWADLQKAAAEAPVSPLQDATTAALKDAHVVTQPNGTVAVQLKAGDYAKVSEAHAATAPEKQPEGEPEKNDLA